MYNVLMMCDALVMYRARRSEARIQQMMWKVNYSDIVFVNMVCVLIQCTVTKELFKTTDSKSKNKTYSQHTSCTSTDCSMMATLNQVATGNNYAIK